MKKSILSAMVLTMGLQAFAGVSIICKAQIIDMKKGKELLNVNVPEDQEIDHTLSLIKDKLQFTARDSAFNGAVMVDIYEKDKLGNLIELTSAATSGDLSGGLVLTTQSLDSKGRKVALTCVGK